MEELYLIMNDFLQVEYRQKALLYCLKTLEDYYSEEEQEELKLLVSTEKWALEELQEHTKDCINRLDNYITLTVRKK